MWTALHKRLRTKHAYRLQQQLVEDVPVCSMPVKMLWTCGSSLYIGVWLRLESETCPLLTVEYHIMDSTKAIKGQEGTYGCDQQSSEWLQGVQEDTLWPEATAMRLPSAQKDMEAIGRPKSCDPMQSPVTMFQSRTS